MASVRRTVALGTVAIELTALTGPILLTIFTDVGGKCLRAAAEALPGLHFQQVGAEGADPCLQLLA